MKISFALSLLFVAASLHAADPLIDRLGVSATALKEHDYAKALKVSSRVVDEMMGVLGPGDAEAKWFAVAVTHEALALAGLGKEEEAIWQWQMAQNIYPDIAQSDLSMFGAPAELLKQHPLLPARANDVPHVGQKLEGGGTVAAPVIVSRVEPKFPLGARSFGVSGIIILESRISDTGEIHSMRVLKALPSPTLTYAAMDAVRKWKFRPGTLDGKPVEVLFNLTINFKLR